MYVCDNPAMEVVKTPTLSVYIRKENYIKLALECERLGMGESEFINKVLEVYFNAQKEKNLQAGA